MGKNLKPIVRAEYAWIGEVDGEPAAMTVTLPNVNEAIADLGGRLLPFGWAKLLWRLKVQGTRTARMPLMGVRKKYQGTPRGAALALGVIEAVRSWHARTAPRRPSCPGCSRTTGRPATSSSWSAAARTRPTGSTRSPWRERWPRRRGPAFTALVLAGSRGPDDPVARAGGVAHKCLVPVAGVPMAVRVVETLAACPSIGRIAIALQDPRCSRICRRCAR